MKLTRLLFNCPYINSKSKKKADNNSIRCCFSDGVISLQHHLLPHVYPIVAKRTSTIKLNYAYNENKFNNPKQRGIF